MIGSNGSGKSSTGNCILSEEKFKVSLGIRDGTDKIQQERTVCNGTEIVLTDTPGVREINDFKKNLTDLDVPETTVYAIVIAIGRYNTLDKKILEVICTEHDILKRSFLIFTRRNELHTFENENDRTIDKWLDSVHTLTTFIRDHKIQFRVFENKDKNQNSRYTQVKDVIDLCKEIINVRDDNNLKAIIVK